MQARHASPATPRRRSLFRLVAWGGGITFIAVVASFVLLPIELGWLVRWVAAWTRPGGPEFSLTVDSVVWRWRPGSERASIEVAGLLVRIDGRTEVRLGRATIELAKRELWSRRLAPALARMEGLAVQAPLPTSTSPRNQAAGPVPSPAVMLAPVLEAVAAELAPDGGVSLVELVGPRFTPAQGRGFAAIEPVRIVLRLAREGDGLRAEMDLDLPGGGAAPELSVVARATRSARSARVSAQARELDLASLPAWLLPGDVVIGGPLSLDASLELGLEPLRLVAAEAACSCPSGTLRFSPLPATLPFSDFVVRVRAGGEPLVIKLEEARVRADGARFRLEGTEVELGAELRARWDLSLEELAWQTLVARLPAGQLASLPPVLEKGSSLRVRSLISRGRVSAVRESSGQWTPREIDVVADASLGHAEDNCRLNGSAQMAAGGGLRVRADVGPLVPAAWTHDLLKLAGPPEVRLPVTLGLDGTLRPDLTAGKLTLKAELGGGTVTLPSGGMRPLAILGASALAEVDLSPLKVSVRRAVVRTDGPSVSVDSLDLRSDPAGKAEIALAVSAENVSGEWLEREVGPVLKAPLAEIGLSPREVRIGKLALTASSGAKRQGASWTASAGRLHWNLEAWVPELPLELKGQAEWEDDFASLRTSATVQDFKPSRLRLGSVAGLPSPAILDAPLGGTLSAELSPEGRIRGLKAALHAGPGLVRRSSFLEAEIPLRSFSVELASDGAFLNVRMPSLRIELEGGVSASLRDVAWARGVAGGLRGRLDLDRARIESILGLLPPTLQAEAGRMRPAGLLEGARMEFALSADPQQGWRLDALAGRTRIESAQLREPSGQVWAELGSLELDLQYPRAVVTLGGLTLPRQVRGALDARIEARLDAGLRSPLGLKADLSRIRLPEERWREVQLCDRLEAGFSIEGERSYVLSLRSNAVLGRPLALQARAALDAEGGIRAEVEDLRFGSSHLSGRYSLDQRTGQVVSFAGQFLDVAELIGSATPFLAGPAVATDQGKPAVSGGAATPADPPPLTFEGSLDRIQFGSGVPPVRLTSVRGRLTRAGPEELSLRMLEGDNNPLVVELAPADGGQRLELRAGDAGSWLRTTLAPLLSLQLPPGSPLDDVRQLGVVPNLVAGGAVELVGRIRGRESFEGALAVSNATLTRLPRVLQLLALQSGRQVGLRPLVKTFEVGRLLIDPQRVEVGGVGLTGSGLIDRLKVRSASYVFDSGRVAAEGDYFGIGFEVSGTRATPQVFLKDSNLLLRTIGQRNEFDFESMTNEPPPAKPAAPAKAP